MATLIVPESGDYTRAGGRLVADPAAGMLNAVYLRLRQQRGSYWGDKTLGSRLHLLKKDVPRVQILARQYTEEALKDLLDAGRINSLAITIRQPERGKLEIYGEARLPTGVPFSFTHFVQVS